MEANDLQPGQPEGAIVALYYSLLLGSRHPNLAMEWLLQALSERAVMVSVSVLNVVQQATLHAHNKALIAATL